MRLELVGEATTELDTDTARRDSRLRKCVWSGDTRVVWFQVEKLEESNLKELSKTLFLLLYMFFFFSFTTLYIESSFFEKKNFSTIFLAWSTWSMGDAW